MTGKSKQLSWLLRHGATEAGLEMDAAGWCAVDDVLRRTGLSRRELAVLVEVNTKRRLQLEGDRVRCSQGHSLAGVPVTLEALEASWTLEPRTEPLFHGTRPEVVETLLREGILPMGRTHVHLADATDSTVGKRANVGALVVVDAARMGACGRGLWVSPNGVWLARDVPADCIADVRAVSRRARRLRPGWELLLARAG